MIHFDSNRNLDDNGDSNLSDKDQISCLMDGGIEQPSPNPNSANAANGKRRKRSASTEKQKYGCPAGFKRVSQYMCLHHQNTSDGESSVSTLSEAKSYCKSQNGDADIVSIESSDKAIRTWNWLGLIIVYMISKYKAKLNCRNAR